MPPAILTITLNPAIDLHLGVPAIHTGDVLRANSATRAAGGKGINVSRVLSILGVRSSAAVSLGGGDSLAYLSLLGRYRFDLHLLPSPGAVRTNVTIAGAGGRTIKVNQPGPRWTAAQWKRTFKELRSLMAGRRWVVLAGAPPPGAPADCYLQLAEAARRAGAKIAVDASGDGLLAALRATPDLVRVNRDESTGIDPKSCPAVCISDGPRVVRFVCAGIEYKARPPAIKVQGAVGAGDAMLAGMLASFLKSDSPEAALRLGVACGAACAEEPETHPPKLARIKKLAAAVCVTSR